MKQLFFEDLHVGMNAALERTVQAEMIDQFAHLSGDTNPLHLDEKYAATTRFGERIAHGALSASFVSAVLGTKLPGVGAVYLSQSVRYLAPVKIGDTVRSVATITGLISDKRRVQLETVCFVDDKTVLEGRAEIYVPTRG